MASKELNFTKNSIASLPLPAGKQFTHYYDKKSRGLCVRISPTGTRTFIVYRKINGKPERISIGRFPDLTVEQARGKAAAINAAIASGDNPASARRVQSAELTLGQAFEHYQKRYVVPHNKKTAIDMEANFKRYLAELPNTQPKLRGRPLAKPPGSVNWQHRRISTISKAEITKLHTDLGAHCGNTTANRTIELLRAVITKAIQWNLYDGTNPAQGVTKFRLKSRERYLQADELPRFFDALSAETDTLFRNFILISLFTGARRGNVLAMTWKQVNFERATWFIPETKNGEPQTIPLTAKVIEILSAMRHDENKAWVFPGRDVNKHMAPPNKRWAALLKRANLSDLHLHDLRRSLGSWQAATGASLAVIGKTLNHKDTATTAIYARLDLDPVRLAMNKAESAIMAAAAV